jgi:hypothetical protein
MSRSRTLKPEKPKKTTRRRRSSSPKKGKDDREYVLLRKQVGGKWEEAFAPDAKGEHLKTGKKDEPSVVVARNGESALRRAYKLLVDDDNPANMTLVATPAPYFKPEDGERAGPQADRDHHRVGGQRDLLLDPRDPAGAQGSVLVERRCAVARSRSA